MAKKKTIENAANSLADELLANSGAVPTAVSQNGSENKTEAQQSDASWTHFTVICSNELVEKIKAIAKKENFSIRDVVEKSFRNTISSYESKNGKIKLKPKKQKNIDDVL